MSQLSGAEQVRAKAITQLLNRAQLGDQFKCKGWTVTVTVAQAGALDARVRVTHPGGDEQTLSAPAAAAGLAQCAITADSGALVEAIAAPKYTPPPPPPAPAPAPPVSIAPKAPQTRPEPLQQAKAPSREDDMPRGIPGSGKAAAKKTTAKRPYSPRSVQAAAEQAKPPAREDRQSESAPAAPAAPLVAYITSAAQPSAERKLIAALRLCLDHSEHLLDRIEGRT